MARGTILQSVRLDLFRSGRLVGIGNPDYLHHDSAERSWATIPSSEDFAVDNRD
jgi:hypothetical protein